MISQNYTEHNAHTIDQWVRDGWEWGKEIDHETWEKAKQGNWSVLLTPTKPVPKEWFCTMQGAKILGLASGGGQQMPIFTALGAECTVLDYSKEQLKKEEMVAAREGYEIQLVQADMTKPLPFDDGSFDLIFHPVSNCYVKDVKPIWKECFRLLKKAAFCWQVLTMVSIICLPEMTKQPFIIRFHLIRCRIRNSMRTVSSMMMVFSFPIRLKNRSEDSWKQDLS